MTHPTFNYSIYKSAIGFRLLKPTHLKRQRAGPFADLLFVFAMVMEINFSPARMEAGPPGWTPTP